jgi:hypothetical protein
VSRFARGLRVKIQEDTDMSQHDNPLGSIGSMFGSMLDPFGVVSSIGGSLFGGNKGGNGGGHEQGGGLLDSLPGVGGMFGGIGNMVGGLFGQGQNDDSGGMGMLDPLGVMGMAEQGIGGLGQMLMGLDGGVSDLFSHFLD